MPTAPEILSALGDALAQLNLIHLGWTLGYGAGAVAFTFAARRSRGRLRDAEDELMPESILLVARTLLNLVGALAILGWLHTIVGVLAILGLLGPHLASILVVAALVFGVTGYLEVSGFNALKVAVRREARDGLWTRHGLRPPSPPEPAPQAAD
jgi:hypothetical protein